ncbi:MAG: hypothetical protein HPY53_03385 [Brevinematales bacterium]|nr:hypothetical protein [Brevinematales bacterium]
MKGAVLLLAGLLLFSSCALFDELLNPGDINHLIISANDLIAPVVTIVSPTNGQSVNEACSVTLDILEEGSGVNEVNVSKDKVSWIKASLTGNYWTGILNLPIGSNTIYVYATDKRGNCSSTNSVDVISVGPAVIAISYPVEGEIYYNQISAVLGNAFLTAPQKIVAIDISVNGGGFVNITNNTGTNSTAWSFTAGSLVYGTNTLQARVVSSLGITTLSEIKTFLLVHQETNIFYNLNAAGACELGWSIAVTPDGNTIVAGAPRENSYTGAVYYYNWNGSTWITNKFIYANLADNDRLGVSISVSSDGNTIIAGATGDDGKGAVYRFYYDGTKWISNKFIAYDGLNGDTFGVSVAVSSNGNTFITGAVYKNANQGAVYRFHWTGSNWITNTITACDASSDGHFGWAVAITPDGDTFAVSAPLDDENGVDSGAVYRFKWNGSVWLTNKIMANSESPADYLGVGSYDSFHALFASSTPLLISSDGNTVIAGAIGKNSYQGGVYRFVWNGSSFDETQFSAYDGVINDYFGSSVAATPDGNNIIVGAYQVNSQQGAVYHFKWNGGMWTTNKITVGTGGDYFGSSVAVSPDGNIIYAGAPGTDEPVGEAGAVYQFINSQ